jgi:predicted DCC family thiol-disulfide oxidoreductase YuxK
MAEVSPQRKLTMTLSRWSTTLKTLCFTAVLTARKTGAFATVHVPHGRTASHSPFTRVVRSSSSSVDVNQDEVVSANLLDSKTISSRVFQSDRRPIILFDGVCNLCNNAVNLALDWDPKGKLRFAALQSNVGRALLEANGRRPTDISSIVLVTAQGAYVKSDAVLKISEELNPLPFLPLKPVAALGRFVVPKFLRDLIYDGVADNRYSLMGQRNECRFDADGEFEDRFVDEAIALRS